MTPGKAGGLCKPKRALYRQASQKALKKSPLASLAPQPVNGRCLSKINFLKTVNMLIFSRFARYLKRKLFTLPSRAGGSHFAKAYKRKSLGARQGFFFGSKTRALHSFFSRGTSCSGQGRSWKTGSQVTCSAGWK